MKRLPKSNWLCKLFGHKIHGYVIGNFHKEHCTRSFCNYADVFEFFQPRDMAKECLPKHAQKISFELNECCGSNPALIIEYDNDLGYKSTTFQFMCKLCNKESIVSTSCDLSDIVYDWNK